MYGRRLGSTTQTRRVDPFDQAVGRRWPLRTICRSPPRPDTTIKDGALTVDDILDNRVVVQKRPESVRFENGNSHNEVVKIVRQRRRQRQGLQHTASYRLLDLLKGNRSRVCDGRTCFGIWPSELDDAVDSAIAEGADLEHTDADGNFPLAVVVHYRRAASVVERLLCAEAEPHRAFRDGSLLDLALNMVHSRPYISALLQRNVKPQRSPSAKESSLMVIARLYDLEDQARTILDQLLFEAIKYDDAQVLQCVITHGIELQNVKRRDPLHYAISISASLQIVESLLQNGCDPNKLDEERHCPLQIAILRQRSFAIVSLLLRYGADPSQSVSSYDEDGQMRLVPVEKFAADNGISQDSIDAISYVYQDKKRCDDK